MFKTSQRYLAAKFIPPFLGSALFFIIFLLTFQLFRIIRIVIGKGVEFTTILELTFHIAISFIPMAIPLSALFATIYTLNQLSSDSEIVAMRSFGISKHKLFLPFAFIALIIAGTTYHLNQNIIPLSKKLFRNRIISISSKGMLSNLKSGDFFIDIPGITLFAEEVTDGGRNLRNVFISIVKKDGHEKIITATKGRLIPSTSLISSTKLHLKDGNIIDQYQDDENKVEKVIFKEHSFPIVHAGSSYSTLNKESMRTGSELRKGIRASIIKAKGQFNRGIVKQKLELYSRINTPIMILIFILLGFSLGIKHSRGKNRSSGPPALIIVTVFYAITFFGISLAKKGTIPPALAIFLPTFIATIYGLKMYKKIDWIT